MQTTIHWLSLAFDRLVAFLPDLIAGIAILLLGYIVAIILAKATRVLAHRLGFDRFIARLGLGELRSTKPPSYHLGSVVMFVILVATIMQASRAWDLGFVANGLARFIAYLPHVLAASAVFAVALFLGNWVRDRLTRSARDVAGRQGASTSTTTVGGDVVVVDTASTTELRTEVVGLRRAEVLPSAVRAGILAVGSFMALRELQIAPEIVSSAFILIVAAVALASALAFGLGARDTAARIARSWYERGDGAARAV